MFLNLKYTCFLLSVLMSQATMSMKNVVRKTGPNTSENVLLSTLKLNTPSATNLMHNTATMARTQFINSGKENYLSRAENIVKTSSLPQKPIDEDYLEMRNKERLVKAVRKGSIDEARLTIKHGAKVDEDVMLHALAVDNLSNAPGMVKLLLDANPLLKLNQKHWYNAVQNPNSEKLYDLLQAGYQVPDEYVDNIHVRNIPVALDNGVRFNVPKKIESLKGMKAEMAYGKKFAHVSGQDIDLALHALQKNRDSYDTNVALQSLRRQEAAEYNHVRFAPKDAYQSKMITERPFLGVR